MTQTPIVTLTLNPALDMSTEVPRLVPDEKLRCAEPVLDPGGGGLNVSRAVMTLGGESLALVALGGLTGDRLAGLIRTEGVPFLALTAPGETRQSLTVTEKASGHQYRFMLPGPIWAETDQERVFTLLRASARAGAFGVISGSQPPGVPLDFPARLARAMPGLMVILDTSGPALSEAVSHPIPGLEVLRMDGYEAEQLAGRSLTSRADTADFAESLARRGVARAVIVARGADGSVLASAGERLHCAAASVKVVSTIGAGDSFVAGYVLARARGQDNAAALSLASAAASSAVTTPATELCRAADVMRLMPECTVSSI
ncbi:MAG: 1-phosphofructokinase family hexose kinase [Paracoccaceae bacterium]